MESNHENPTSADRSLPICDLLSRAEQAMIDAHYQLVTIYRYHYSWKRGLDYAQRTGYTGPLSNEFIEDWLAAEGYPIGNWPCHRPAFLSNLLTSLRILVQVHEFGTIVPGCVLKPIYRFAHLGRHPESYSITVLGQSTEELRVLAFPESFRQACNVYIQDCRDRGFSRMSLLNTQSCISRFFTHAMEQGVEEFADVTAQHLSGFFTSLAGFTPSTVGNYGSMLRCWLRFLRGRNLVPEDMSRWVPPAPIRHYPRIPTVWSPDEVERLLAQVDRNSPKGKRDYAILLLASRIGMRVGDIIRLELDNLKWDQRRIEIHQSKTRQPLVVPLLDDLGWAIIDYLKHGRPITPFRQVFLRHQPPYAPFSSRDNLYHIVTRYRLMAGIQRYKRQHVGMHTFRHSLATQLLVEDTPLPVISEVLGHASKESTNVYTKVDLPHLRLCALDPEEVPNVSK